MSKKPSKKVKKITHVRLKKKEGETFDFTKPYELLEEKKLTITTVDAEVGGTYIEVPEFLQFQSTKKQSKKEVGVYKALETEAAAQLETVENSETIQQQDDTLATQTKKGAFQKYFEEKSFSGLYRTKATYKSILFAVLGALSFCGLLVCATIATPTALMAAFIFGTVSIVLSALFFIMCVDRFVVYLYALFFGVALLFAGALAGMMNFITVLIALFVVFLVLFAFQETERLQVINRIFDVYHITRPASRIMNIIMVTALLLGITNSFSNKSVQTVYQEWIKPTAFVESFGERATAITPLTDITIDLLEVKDFESFNQDKKTTAFDYVLFYDYGNNLVNAASDNAVRQSSNPLITSTERDQILTTSAYQAVETVLRQTYGVTYSPEQKLEKTQYYLLTHKKVINSLSQVSSSWFTSSNGFFAMQQTFPAFVLALLLSLAYAIVWSVYRILNAFFNLFGLSVEKLLWVLLKLFKLVKVETENLESEIIVV